MKRTLLIATLGLAAWGQSALAQTPPPGQPPSTPPTQRPERPGPRNELRPRLDVPFNPLLRVLDENQDGELSETEIANASAALRKLDRNQDGKLTREELRPQSPGGPGDRRGQEGVVDRVMSQDKNGDGKVSREELPEQMQRNFERLDANGDGFIDRTEAEAVAGRVRPNGVPSRAPPPQRPPSGDEN